VSTCFEVNRQRKLARPVYLELRALGLDLHAGDDPQEPLDYYVEVRAFARFLRRTPRGWWGA
jgi:hypothetical protein